MVRAFTLPPGRRQQGGHMEQSGRQQIGRAWSRWQVAGSGRGGGDRGMFEGGDASTQSASADLGRRPCSHVANVPAAGSRQLRLAEGDRGWLRKPRDPFRRARLRSRRYEEDHRWNQSEDIPWFAHPRSRLRLLLHSSGSVSSPLHRSRVDHHLATIEYIATEWQRQGHGSMLLEAASRAIAQQARPLAESPEPAQMFVYADQAATGFFSKQVASCHRVPTATQSVCRAHCRRLCHLPSVCC